MINWEAPQVGVGDAIAVTDQWQLFSVSKSLATSVYYWGLRIQDAGDAIDIAFPSVLTAADHAATGGAYQRVGAATDYDTSNSVWRPYLAPDGVDDWMPTSPLLDLGETWWHVGAWRSDAAQDAAFATLHAYPGALYRDSGNDWDWRLDADTGWGALVVGDVSVAHVATVQRNSDSSISGRYNGGGATTINPTDDDAYTRGLALFSRLNNSFERGLAGRFYGGAWWLVPPSEADQAAVEAWMAAKAGVTLP